MGGAAPRLTGGAETLDQRVKGSAGEKARMSSRTSFVAGQGELAQSAVFRRNREVDHLSARITPSGRHSPLRSISPGASHEAAGFS